jgi:hypothetical protein
MTQIDQNYHEMILDLYCNLSPCNFNSYYEENLRNAIENDLWEYGVILIWKSVIVFCYEKMFQLNKLGLLNQNILDSLKTANKDCLDIFSFNHIKDNKLGDDLSLVFRNLDQNFQNSFRALLDERNSMSHVNSYPYSKTKFNDFFFVDEVIFLQMNY